MTTLRPELEVAALSGEVDAVMRGIVERLMLLTHADGASISTIDDGFAYFRVCAGEDLPLQGRTFRLEETLGAVCMNGELAVLPRQAVGARKGAEVRIERAILLHDDDDVLDGKRLRRGVAGDG